LTLRHPHGGPAGAHMLSTRFLRDTSGRGRRPEIILWNGGDEQ
jgi:hypothetical protein